jgi:flavin reductase (DIM6/NTAB) family NADH-FMN oxidoreductase RutF
MVLQEINPKKLEFNPFQMMDDAWVLITAGIIEKYNMMTASWGTLGFLWGKPIVTIFVRPSRYTYDFLEDHKTFSITSFTKEYKKILDLCGTESGRQFDKMNIPEITPIQGEHAVYFKEAKIAIECEKIYFQNLDPERIPSNVKQTYYKNGDYHRVYIGKILKLFHNQ